MKKKKKQCLYEKYAEITRTAPVAKSNFSKVRGCWQSFHNYLDYLFVEKKYCFSGPEPEAKERAGSSK